MKILKWKTLKNKLIMKFDEIIRKSKKFQNPNIILSNKEIILSSFKS